MGKNVLSLSSFIGFLGLVLLFVTTSTHPVSAKNNNQKVTICHTTASTSNPYVTETVDLSSLGDGSGHGHSGINSGDIIPPTPNSDYPNGQNWTTNGQAIWNNGCNTPTPTIAQPTATPTPTAIPTATPTVTPTPSTTLDCDGDTDGNNPNSDDICTTPTPTPTLDCDGDTDGGNPNSDDVCTTPTPTVTPANPTATPTPGSSNGGNSGGGDGRSDGLSSCPSCTQAPQAVLGASTDPQQGVLGASTMASTGTFEENAMNLLAGMGIILMSISAGYAKIFKKKLSY